MTMRNMSLQSGRICKAVQTLHKSLHGCSLICWCMQSGKPGSPCPCNSFILIVGARHSVSKTNGDQDFIQRDTEPKKRPTFQGSLNSIKTSVTAAGARVQDGLQGSKEKFLGSFYSLQTQTSDSENGSTKPEDDKESTCTFVDSYEVKTPFSGEADAIPESDARSTDQGLNRLSESDEPCGIQPESSTTRDDASKVKDSSVKFTQTEYWINIPSFQDRINRIKVPFWRTNVSPKSEANGAILIPQTEGKIETTQRGSQTNGEHQVYSTSNDTDSFKPVSIDVTAEQESEPVSPKRQLQGVQDAAEAPSVTVTGKHIPSFANSLAKRNSIKSIQGVRSTVGPSSAKKDKVLDNNSLSFDLKANPILRMNLALQENSQGILDNKQVIVEMDARTKISKQKATDVREVTAKKTKKPVKLVVSKTSIDDRTKNLAIGVCRATSHSLKLLKLERLSAHVTQYPESRDVAVKEKLIPTLLKLRTSWDIALTEQVNEMLSLLGYAPPVKGRGLRILSIDGGGTRGVIAIETLREIERRTNKCIQELFDYVMGVSSGAVLGFLLGIEKASLDECEQLYTELSREVFKRNTLLGTSKLFLSHAFYDTDGWIKILKSHSLSDRSLISTSRHESCPKVAAVATLMNVGSIKDYIFRNYNHPPGTQSRYRGSCKYHLWQAARASSAAPGYFEECKLDEFVFQDGGVLTNNPCALAVHECRLLWPETPIQCVVSVGCGRYDPEETNAEPEYSSLKKKLTDIMISATDTESVHTVLQDLLPSGTYFRFNPPISEDFFLDENRPEKIDQMQQEARDYLDLNELKLIQASGVLTRQRRYQQKALDWLRMQWHMRRC